MAKNTSNSDELSDHRVGIPTATATERVIVTFGLGLLLEKMIQASRTAVELPRRRKGGLDLGDKLWFVKGLASGLFKFISFACIRCVEMMRPTEVETTAKEAYLEYMSRIVSELKQKSLVKEAKVEELERKLKALGVD